MAVVLPWLVWAIVRTFGLEGGTRIVPAMTFTPYVGLTSPVPVIAAVLLRRRGAAALGLVVMVAFALVLLPRALAGPRPALHDGVALRVMTANLFEGRGDPRTVVDLVRRHGIDLLALEELPPEALARLDRAGLRRLLPYRVVDARPWAGGTGLFSRRPLQRRPPANRLNYNGEPRAILRVPGALPVDVQAVHPPPPIHGRTPLWRTMLGELARPDGGPVLRLLLGDFNATLDHQQLRRLLDDGGYVDAGDATGNGYDTTWPAGRDFPPEITIDHVLLDPRAAARSLSVHLVPGSDHRAVIAALELPRAP